MDKSKYNPDLHHRRSIRLKVYDYSQSGLYFITICCQDKICHFGKIENEIMILNDLGKIANECWLAIPTHFPNAVLHEYVVMPNHIHGIIELTNNAVPNNAMINVGAKNISPKSPDTNPPTNNVVANNMVPKNIIDNDIRAKNFSPLPPPQPQNGTSKTIGSMVRGFKIGVTMGAKNILPDIKLWQRNYYEHIIRNEQSYQLITNYIMNNPIKWSEDKFYIKE